jgi:hypothetical protein
MLQISCVTPPRSSRKTTASVASTASWPTTWSATPHGLPVVSSANPIGAEESDGVAPPPHPMARTARSSARLTSAATSRGRRIPCDLVTRSPTRRSGNGRVMSPRARPCRRCSPRSAASSEEASRRRPLAHAPKVTRPSTEPLRTEPIRNWPEWAETSGVFNVSGVKGPRHPQKRRGPSASRPPAHQAADRSMAGTWPASFDPGLAPGPLVVVTGRSPPVPPGGGRG